MFMEKVLLKRKLIIAFAFVGVFSLLLLLLFYRKPVQLEEVILAKVADRDISVAEFIRRAEYTIRPRYCKGNYNVHKKIILNSLIAEKLLAIETEKNDPDVIENERILNYLKGRKEQAMRQYMYYDVAVKKVKLDSSLVRRTFRLAGRRYRIKYFFVDDSAVGSLKKDIATGKASFDSLFQKYSTSKAMYKDSLFFYPFTQDPVAKYFYTTSVKKGEIVGSIKIDGSGSVVIMVEGWRERLAITDTDRLKRQEDVQKWLTDIKAAQIYEGFVKDIMKGKSVHFNSEVFRRVGKLLMPVYFRMKRVEGELFLNATFGKNVEIGDTLLLHFKDKIADLRNEIFFNVDGKEWTVGDFEKELQRHPLVFRKKSISPQEFPEQFKLAVVDMIRDYYLTKEAYRRGYDRVNVVKRVEDMWRDAILAEYGIRKYLRGKGIGLPEKYEERYKIIETYINPYVDSLQKKYDSEISVNLDEFEKIKLTRIDMFVLQFNVPFPVVVPPFPEVTTDYRLDYGRKM